MTDSPSPARRLAGAWAAVSGLSMTGHLAGGAAMPSPVAVALVAILGLTVAALLTRGDAPVRTTTAVWVLGAFQGVAHLILHHVTGTAAVTTAAAHAAHMTHATHGTTAVSAASAMS
ncbi:MAG: hypothetical protein Q4G34_06005, partial [Micrococcus sp.]|nr:hypothetical protein [Micrococcus sp.]